MISAFCGPYTINIETGPVYIYLNTFEIPMILTGFWDLS